MTGRRLSLLVVIMALVQPVSAQDQPPPRLLDEIRQEATRANHHDRVEITNSPDLNIGKAYRNRTIAFWYRADRKDRPKEPRQVLYEEGGPGSGLNVYLDGSVLYGGAWNEGKGAWLQSKELDLRGWHHAALVLGANGAKDAEVPLKLYLDGQEVAEGKAPALGAHPGDINLGRCGNTLFHDRRRVEQPGHYFAGRLDDFRIANRSLIPEEVRALAGAR
jgi:hypothetical protein